MMDKSQISKMVKGATTKPAQDVETRVMAHINKLETKINELEQRLEKLENNPKPATFG